MPPRRKAAAKTTEAPAELAVVNGLMTPVSSTGSTRTTPKAMPATKKEDNLLTPAYTPERSIKQEDFADWQPKSEVIVEIPTRGASQMEIDSPFEEDVKPVIKSRAKKRSHVTESESELGPKPALKRRASARPALKQTRSTRSAASRTSTRGKDRSIPDDEIEFTASEESEAYAEFAGDDSELDSDPELPAKGRKTPSKPARKSTAGTNKEKGKKLGGKKVQAIQDEELNTEDEMLQAAIAASLEDVGKAGPSKPRARNSAAEKRARAAEKRLGIVISSDDDYDDDFILEGESDLSDDPDFAVSPSAVKQESYSVVSTSNPRHMDITTMKARRAAENKKKREEGAPLLALKREMMKKLKRKLTWAEINAIALGYHHPELKDVWGDLQAKIKPIVPTTMDAHPGLKLTLLPFQKESLFWMKKQEEGPWKGGMLADEMGMGKTIQTIALLLSEPRNKPSLVVAPVVALMQWKHEIETHAEGFTVCLWHGQGRMKAEDLKKFDVVMVSYGTLEASFRKQQKGFTKGDRIIKEKSPMHTFQWYRVILDEAHNIKERSTNAAKAAFALDAKYRWCLSGTPLQNRVGELYSLVRFLGGDPFAFYYCKRCPCKSLHWQFGNKRNCDDCGHSPMQHTCYWNNEILTPIQKHGMQGAGADAFKKLKILLDRCMLRRTKIERADDLGLPPRTITVRRGFFSPEERELYMSLFSETRRQFSTYIAEGTILNNYSNVFSLITRMRQMACHPDLVLRSKTSAYVQAEEEVVCRLCHDTAEDAIVSKCNHLFDRECITQYVDGHDDRTAPVCPVCHIELTIDLGAEAVESGEQKKLKKQGILGRLDLNNWRSSTKLEMLVDELCELRDKDCNIKSLVFSQFVSMLDLAAFRLQRAGFNICRLEGGMTPQARDATIQHFMKNPQVTVFLISLKAGGVALNLTEASQVFLLDSWWNPSVEYQSMDRIHRLGQHRPVQVTKLVVEDSIEAKILQLQDKKLAMTQAALATDPDSALGKLTEEDMQFLFRL